MFFTLEKKKIISRTVAFAGIAFWNPYYWD